MESWDHAENSFGGEDDDEELEEEVMVGRRRQVVGILVRDVAVSCMRPAPLTVLLEDPTNWHHATFVRHRAHHVRLVRHRVQ